MALSTTTQGPPNNDHQHLKTQTDIDEELPLKFSPNMQNADCVLGHTMADTRQGPRVKLQEDSVAGAFRDLVGDRGEWICLVQQADW